MYSVVMHCITQCVKHNIAYCNSTNTVLALIWSISVTKNILLDFPYALLNFQNHCSPCLDMSFQEYHTESNTRLDIQILMKFHICQKFYPLLKAQGTGQS